MYNSYIIPFEDVANLLKHLYVFEFYKTDTHVFILRLAKQSSIPDVVFSIVIECSASRFLQSCSTELSSNFQSGSMFEQLQLQNESIYLQDICYKKNNFLSFLLDKTKILINLREKNICSNFSVKNKQQHLIIQIESNGEIILGPSNIPLNDYCNDGKLHTGLLSDWI